VCGKLVTNDNVTSSLPAVFHEATDTKHKNNYAGFNNSYFDMRDAHCLQRNRSVLAAAQVFLATAASSR